MRILKVESAGQPQRDRDLDELWVTVTNHVAHQDDLAALATILQWAAMGQVVRITIDGR